MSDQGSEARKSVLRCRIHERGIVFYVGIRIKIFSLSSERGMEIRLFHLRTGEDQLVLWRNEYSIHRVYHFSQVSEWQSQAMGALGHNINYLYLHYFMQVWILDKSRMPVHALKNNSIYDTIT